MNTETISQRVERLDSVIEQRHRDRMKAYGVRPAATPMCKHHVTASQCKVCNTEDVRMLKDWKARAIQKHYRVVTVKLDNVLRHVAYKGNELIGSFDLFMGDKRRESKGWFAHLGRVTRQF